MVKLILIYLSNTMNGLIIESCVNTWSFNPLSANPTKGQTHSNNLSTTADELFECVWPFCAVSAWRVKIFRNHSHYSFKEKVFLNSKRS